MLQPKRVLVAGHICLDIIPELSEADFKPGNLLPVARTLTATGGAVPNTGLALHRLGVPVRLAGKVGDDLFGREIRRLVEAELGCVDTGLRCDNRCASSHTVVLNPPGRDRTFLHCPGANDHFGPEDVPVAELAESALLHFGYPPLMRRMYADRGRELVELVRMAKGAGVGVSLDLARTSAASASGQADWGEILHAALPWVDFFLPSIDELLFMLDPGRFTRFEAAVADGAAAGGLTKRDLHELSDRLLGMGAGAVLMKLGSAGLYLRVSPDRKRLEQTGRAYFPGLCEWAGYERYLPCYEVTYVGGTGAGDCTIAGFLAAVMRGFSPDDAMDCALAAGACNVEAPDALGGIPDWPRLQERIHRGWRRRPASLPDE